MFTPLFVSVGNCLFGVGSCLLLQQVCYSCFVGQISSRAISIGTEVFCGKHRLESTPLLAGQEDVNGNGEQRPQPSYSALEQWLRPRFYQLVSDDNRDKLMT